MPKGIDEELLQLIEDMVACAEFPAAKAMKIRAVTLSLTPRNFQNRKSKTKNSRAHHG
jgi:hypothetical protein